MSVRIEQPKILTATDMFLWWCKEKIRKKRHMKIKYQTSHAKDTILVSNNRDELEWLHEHISVLEEQIMKIEELEKNKHYFTKNVEKIYEFKKDIYDAKERIKHLENVNPDAEQIVMSESKFRKILYTFNEKAAERLIHGEVINMKQMLGYMYISKIPRNHPKFFSKANRTVNWAESYKYRQELIDKGIQPKNDEHPDGKNWLVYYTDDWYLKFVWTKKKGACRVKNHTFYAFYPSNGKNGAKKKLVIANEKNKLLHKKYIKRRIYYPKLKEAS